MELSELSRIGTLNPTVHSYPDMGFHESRVLPCLFSKCQHCWAQSKLCSLVGSLTLLRRAVALPTRPGGDCGNVGCPWP